jgi:hypothetical protein
MIHLQMTAPIFGRPWVRKELFGERLTDLVRGHSQVTSIGGIEVGGASGASADRAMELLSGSPGSNVVVKGRRGGNSWSVELARGTGAGGRKVRFLFVLCYASLVGEVSRACEE